MNIRVKRGLRFTLAGAPEQRVCDAPAVTTVALLGSDYVGSRVSVEVEQGDRVRLGQTLFRDRRTPEIQFTAPASGHVAAIQRGPRRSLAAVVVEVDDAEPLEFASWSREALGSLPAETVSRQLLDSGLWTALRARPFDGVAAPGSRPCALFVTAMDTNPLAADPAVVLADSQAEFADGVAVLAALGAPVIVCRSPTLELPALDERARSVSFDGPHPAGLPGTHIAHLATVSEDAAAWYVGYQDVVAIGRLFVSGRLSSERIVAVGGPRAEQPALLRTRLGASLEDLLPAAMQRPGVRVVSGSALSGRALTRTSAWLGRYHTQVTLLDAATSAQRPAHGKRAMLHVEAFERAWPLRTPILPLLRALLVADTETARGLGCLSLAEEDLAACSYLCPAGLDYGAVLRSTLEAIARESAA